MNRKFQLNIRHILDRGAKYFGRKEIVSRIGESIQRYTYREMFSRVCKLSNALKNLGIEYGDHVASMAWNTHRHLELHFAVPITGAVLHTVNLRYSPEEIIYTINKAEDKILFIEHDMIPITEKILDRLKTIKSVILMDGGELKGSNRVEIYSYEDLLSHVSENYSFLDVDENSPAIMCFTSGTTGMPKGVIYTHRGIFLRSMATCLTDTYAISERDVVMHVVPMFHISSWFIPYASTLVGAKQVLPGPRPRPETLYELIANEGVTISDGVPTIWIDFLDYLRRTGNVEKISSLKRLIIGGSAPPLSLIKAYNELGIEVIHAWGMTETYDSAVAFVRVKSYMDNLPNEEKLRYTVKQGLPFPGIEVMVVDEKGNPVPWDGKTSGELMIRGAWVIDEYYKDPSSTERSFFNGWLKTGDVAVIDDEGYIEIVDRLKDIIKSGGEWISSVRIENEAMGHPAILEATAIAVPHPKWIERPLLIVKLVPGYEGKISKHDILNFLKDKLPKWWVPDDVVFVQEIPKIGTGKFDKKLLREIYKGYYGVDQRS